MSSLAAVDKCAVIFVLFEVALGPHCPILVGFAFHSANPGVSGATHRDDHFSPRTWSG